MLHRRRLPSLLALVSPLGLGFVAGVAGCAPAGDSDDGPLGHADEAMTICPGGTTTQGVDVSHYQPNTDWGKVAGSGRGFATVKATEGTGYTDPDFHTNWTQMKANGMVRGAYHFFHPSDDPTAQADYFTGVMGALGDGDLGGALDLEVTDGVAGATIVARAKTFLQRVEANTGKVPLIYTSPGFWNNLGGDKSGFEHFTLWIAHWDTQCPDIPAPWTSFKFWQYADSGAVPGISGGVDHDLFNGSDADLKTFAGSKPTATIAQVNGNDGISLVNWASDKHAELFVKKPNGDIFHVWSKNTTDDWNAPAKLDGNAECGFGSVMWPSPYSYPEVISPESPDGNAGHLWWTAADGWNTFKDLGGKGLGHVSTIIWPDAHAELFALGDDGAIWHDPFVFANGDWAGWTSLGGKNLVTGAGVIRWNDGHVELFATDAHGAVWHQWSGDFPGGWHGWESLGGAIASRPVPVRWADGHVEVFATGKDGHLYHSAWNASAWPAFKVLGPSTEIVGEPGAFMNPKGDGGTPGAEVFARRSDGKVVHLAWNGTKYGSFEALGSQAAGGDPFAWIREDGVAEVFVIDDAGDLAKNYRDPKSGWAGWSPLASGPFDACAKPLQATSGGSGGGGAGPSSGAGQGPGSGAGGADFDGDGSGHDGGCSCELGGDESRSSALILGLALVPLAWRRRRRR